MNYQQALVDHYKTVRARIVKPQFKPKPAAPVPAPELPEPDLEAAPAAPPRSLDPRINILRDCANEYGCAVSDIFGETRKQNVVLARRKAMWLIHQRGTMSKAHIGRFLNKDHTTVVHALRSYEKDLAKRGEVE